MFTGIIEHFGTIESLALTHVGGRVTIHAPTLANSLAVSNSIAVNGCCLTVVSLENGRFSADLSQVQVDFVIDEGKRYIVDKIVFEGAKTVDEAKLRSDIKLAEGSYFDKEVETRDVRGESRLNANLMLSIVLGAVAVITLVLYITKK